MLLFLITNMAAVTSHANNQILQFGFLTCQEGIKLYLFFLLQRPSTPKQVHMFRKADRIWLQESPVWITSKKKIKNPSKYLSLNHATVLNKIKQEALK